MTTVEARAQIERQSVHPSITAQQISELVERFYTRVMDNERLSPIFAKHAGKHWNQHLDTMKRFWRSVLLRTGEYKGKPVVVHQKLDAIGTDDFAVWLSLFTATSQEIFTTEASALVVQSAERIASSLWLSRNTDPFATPPNWQQMQQSHSTN